MPGPMRKDVARIRTKGGVQVFRSGADWDDDPDTQHGSYDAMHYEVNCTPAELALGIDWSSVAHPAMHPERATTWPVCQRGDRHPAVAMLQRMLAISSGATAVLAAGAAGEAPPEPGALAGEAGGVMKLRPEQGQRLALIREQAREQRRPPSWLDVDFLLQLAERADPPPGAVVVTAVGAEDEGRVFTFTSWRGAELRIDVLPDGTFWLRTPGWFLPGSKQSISCVPGA